MIMINTNKNIASLLRAMLIALCLLTFTSTATATIRYVSPTGNNIPPYLNWEDAANVIQDAIDVCEAGDTVLVDNGTYYENLVINTPISLIGSSMDSTVIDGRGKGIITINTNTNISIENFLIYGKGVSQPSSIVIRSLGDSTEIKNCRILEALAGIFIARSCLIDNVFFEKIETGFGNIGASSVSYNNLTNNVFVLEAGNSNAINTGFGTYIITNNIILFTGITSQNSGIVVAWSDRLFISNNLISGFNHNVYFDIVDDTSSIINSLILHGNGQTSSISSHNDNLSIRNNILMSNYTAISGNDISLDYNIFWDNNNNLISIGGQISYGDSDKVADPMFIKDTLPNPQLDFDYHLQAFSPGIDAGDPDILDVDGSRSDIGLYGGPLGQSYKYKDLPPRPPVNLSAVVDTNQILLKWNRNSEADTSQYNVYKDTVSNFTIDSTKLISSQVDTFYIEQSQLKPGIYVYKITCVDNQGNESLPSEEILIDLTTGIDDYPITINDYLLYQNYPNPFNPSTKIGYKLKDRGYVKLMVYDITGAQVSVLVNKEQEAGYYEVEFNVGNGLPSVPDNLASGIYLYRIEISGEGRIPVYSDMKKMLLIK
jgi:hypothetical protein